MGKEGEAKNWVIEARKLKRKINERFYSAEKGYYYDRNLESGKLVTNEGSEGWIPLWTGVASREHAASVAKVMSAHQKFNTKLPLPTFTADHPKFDPLKGYWRGPVWLDQFYFGVDGLRKYGFESEAALLTSKFFGNAEGLLTDGEIRENYHPLTGKGLNALNFSWSAAHILMLLHTKNKKHFENSKKNDLRLGTDFER